MNYFRLKVFFKTLAQFNQINNNQAAVYCALLSFFGKKGCFPSYTTLAVEAGVCERTVGNALREARLRGWIDWTNQRNGRRQSSNHYRFLISNDYINKVLNGLQQLKQKTADIQRFFSQQNLPGSPYYYIKKSSLKLWKIINKPEKKLSSFQKLFKDNPELALKQLQTA